MDPFAMLGAPRRFDLDLAALEKTFREVSRVMYAGDRREALSRAADVNEAWRRLKDPIQRAEALFELEGIAVGEQNEPKPAPAFLMDMMEAREELSEARAGKDLDAVRRLQAALAKKRSAAEARLVDAFAADPEGRPDLRALLPVLGELRFYRRFLAEASATLEEAEEEEMLR